jgi:RecJ-like exonuclease
MMHDEAQTKEGISNLVSVGVLNDVMTIRATESSGFSIHSFLTYLQKHVPSAFVEGGGHKQAGAIKFVPSQREAVLKALKSFLGK